MTTVETRNQYRRDRFFRELEANPAWATAKLVGYYTVSDLKEDSEIAALNDTACEAITLLAERGQYHRATILAKAVYESSGPGEQGDLALKALLNVAEVCVTTADKQVCDKGIDLLEYVYRATPHDKTIKDRFFEVGQMLKQEPVERDMKALFHETGEDVACAKRVHDRMIMISDAQRVSYGRFAKKVTA